MAAPTTTALVLIHAAFDDLGIKAVGESLSAADAQDALARLNAMIDGWALQPGTILNEQRETFPLVAGQGGPSQPYTIGPGGDFDTVRPVWLSGARLLLQTLTTPVERTLELLTDQGYRAIAMKTFASLYPTGAYYNPTQPLGTLFLYPVPTTSANPIVLYSLNISTGFLSLTTPVTLAPGYAEAIHYGLAQRLASPYGVPWTPQLDQLTRQAIGWVKTANARLVDLPLDPMLTTGTVKPYNILTDQ